MNRSRLQMGAGSCVVLLILFGTLLWQHKQTPAQLATDVSWPNCSVIPPSSALGIVGVTGGLDFRPNKCLRNEAAWFPTTALYMNTGWPGTTFHLQFKNSPRACSGGDNLCLAYNYGYHAATYALDYANSKLVVSSKWWLDVETENSWTANVAQNQSALQGMVAGIRQHVFNAQVGFYSYPGQWTQIVGNWKPDLPAWVATGSTDPQVAKQACQEPSFTGGLVHLTQYTLALDQDYLCEH